MSEETLKYIIGRILEYAEDVIQLPRGEEFNDAKRLAYYEMFKEIQVRMREYGISAEEYGLDIDLGLFL